LGDGTSALDLRDIEEATGDDYDTAEYLLVSNKPEQGKWNFIPDDATGFNPLDASFLTEGIALFTETGLPAAKKRVDSADVKASEYQSKLALFMASVAMHEIGHALGLGRRDDDFWEQTLKNGEIYTGSSDDDTKEYINQNGMKARGLMRSGYLDRLIFRHKGTTHFIYTIEELLTLRPINED
jgi:hypothetical protein